MRTLLHHPLISLGVRLWWLPVLAATSVAFYPGFGGGLPWLLLGLGACASLALGVWSVPLLHGLSASALGRRRHAAAQHRFLCSACLEFGDFRFACGACGKEVEATVVHTMGAYVNRCPHCEELLDFSPRGVRSLCGACGATGDRALEHERSVRVVGTLLADDFELLARQRGEAVQETNDLRWFRIDDGKRLTYLLSLDDLNSRGRALDRSYGARAVEVLWLSEAEPLRLGQALDGFLARAEIDDAQLATMTACVAADRLDPAADRLLSARLGVVKYGVPSGDFLPQTPSQPGSRTAQVGDHPTPLVHTSGAGKGDPR